MPNEETLEGGCLVDAVERTIGPFPDWSFAEQEDPSLLQRTEELALDQSGNASFHIHILIAVATAKEASMCVGNAISDSKIDNLQTLLNHNVHPIHIQAMTLVHESLCLSLVYDLKNVPRGGGITSNSLLFHYCHQIESQHLVGP
jgi:hypothetical protein